MKSRLYATADFPVIKKWFEGHSGKAVSEAVLPKCGVIVEDDGGAPLAAAWIYQDNSVGVAWLAWIVTNPAISVRTAPAALEYLLDSAEAICREFNYGLLFTMTDRPALGRWLKKQGFEANHSGMSQYFKVID